MDATVGICIGNRPMFPFPISPVERLQLAGNGSSPPAAFRHQKSGYTNWKLHANGLLQSEEDKDLRLIYGMVSEFEGAELHEDYPRILE